MLQALGSLYVESHALNPPIGILLILGILSLTLGLVVGPQTALLAELFPAKNRNSAVTIPHNLAAGWIGGLLPLILTWINQFWSNDLIGLWYPIIFLGCAAILAMLFLPETYKNNLSNIDQQQKPGASVSIQVIENVIPKDHQDHLERVLLGNQFPLYLNSKSVHLDNKTAFADKNTKESLRLNHSFIHEGQLVSEHWGLIEQLSVAIVQALNLPPKLSSCKLNVNFPVSNFSDSDYYSPHFDTTDKGVIAIYYVNDSDGDTLFFESAKDGINEFKISLSYTPQKGTLVAFPENMLHSNKPPKNTPARCVINFNFLKGF